ncbi:serine/threonine-protein kinase [Polyangium aurulentum]|uniref:serine/threonine-protein kinase n=1 Tax=Polyangium aurulentum TaxID=2567896 RepID=UPI001980FCE1|nr:serine/threonine-protein kinase [Polyangium aurulentum]UQA55844.1 serine/threonine protein kinase [Polyangium aurulentum]
MTKPPDTRSGAFQDDAVTVPASKQQSPFDDDAKTVHWSRPSGESVAVELSSSSILEETTRKREAGGLDALVGQVISGRYQVHELIGQGGMGAVYRGEQVHLRKRVAIKILQPGARRLPELVARFEREAIAGAHVEHPNVVGATDFGQLEDQSYFLVLDFVEGTPLKDVTAKGPLPAERALRIARQIASALEAVHEKGIVHRDLKPQNVMVQPQDHVKVLDFGLAKVPVEKLSSASRAAAKPAPALTGVGTVMGTLGYMAPEAVKGMEAVDARADLYALGIMIYEMLTGLHPFEGDDGVAIFKRQRSEDPPPMRVRAPAVSVPPEAEAIAMRLIQRDPQSRYATATEVIAAIDAALPNLGRPALASMPMPAPSPAPVPAPVAAPVAAPSAGAGWKKFAIPGAVGLVAIAFAATLIVLRSGEDEAPKEDTIAEVPPTPEPVATAEAEKRPTEIDGIDAAGWQDRLKKAAARKDWFPGARAMLALGQIDPDLVVGRELRQDVLAVAAGIGFESESKEADQVFELLANGLGSGGLDVLFDIVRSRGGTKAGRRAGDLLANPEVMARATPALRIAYDLRKASCTEKRELLGRAVEEGDGRALGELSIAYGARCSSDRDPCCFREDKAMADAIKKLKERLGI